MKPFYNIQFATNATLPIIPSNFCFAAGILLCFEKLFNLTAEIPSNFIGVSNL